MLLTKELMLSQASGGNRDEEHNSGLREVLSSSGHVQIAQVPGRNEPDSAGELSYSYLFNTLENHNYQGYIGCEYKPLGECFLSD